MTTAVGGTLLALAVIGAVARPRGLPSWVAAVLAAVVAVAVGVVSRRTASTALHPLVEPLVFLLLAVPLAAMLDELGVFDAAARLARGRHLTIATWLLAITTVALFNLDAAVVLLTPLYVRIARGQHLDAVALAFQPMLAACLASSLLPVSNLTNLIAASDRHLTSVAFLKVLGPPTVAACVVGYIGWWLAFRHRLTVPGDEVTRRPHDRADQRALTIGAATTSILLLGFIPGRSWGLPAWAVVAAVDVGLVALVRRVPWRRVPVGTAALAASLAVLVAAVGRHVPVGAWLGGAGHSAGALVRVVVVGAVAANLVNNLPAFLLGLRAVPVGRPGVWALLLGVNAGPTLLVTGTLSTLIWFGLVHRDHLDVRARDVARVGAVAGLPALAASTAVLLVTARW